MNFVDGYGSSDEQKLRTSVLKPMLANIESAGFEALKQAITTQVNNYIVATTKQIKEESFLSTLFSSHGATGLVRAAKLKIEINRLGANDTAGLLNLINTLDGGNYYQGSLKTYIAKALYEVGTRQGARKVPATRFSEKTDESEGIIITGRGHSHYGAKADFSVVDFLEQVIKSVKEFLAGSNANIAPH